MIGIFPAKAATMADHVGGHVALAGLPHDPPLPVGSLAVAVARSLPLDTLTDSLATLPVWFALVSVIMISFGVWSAVRYPVISTRFGRRK